MSAGQLWNGVVRSGRRPDGRREQAAKIYSWDVMNRHSLVSYQLSPMVHARRRHLSPNAGGAKSQHDILICIYTEIIAPFIQFKA